MAKALVHETFSYLACLETGTDTVRDMNVRWHKKQEMIGETEEGYGSFMSDVERIIFLSDELIDVGITLERGHRIVLDGGEVFDIQLVYPEDYPNITCEVTKV